ncbi:MAG: hypothetical protein HYX39_14315 [Bacteroidetes bacterium]|nr:hypothetical protein [Bacteroidota bacterium]
MKQTLIFSKGQFTESILYNQKPVINISTVQFNTSDNQWVNRLYAGSLIIKVYYLNQNNEELDRFEDHISFGTYISTDHKIPNLTVNKTIHIPIHTQNDPNFLNKWKVIIELSNLNLEMNERIEILIMDKEHIQRRVEDWETRIRNLYSEVQTWIQNQPNFTAQEGSPTIMDEEMMRDFEVPAKKIPTVDILSDGKIKLSFKPKGLWIMGANGRVDVLSLNNGGLLLIDKAESFQPPQWYIVDNTRQQTRWTKPVFFKLLEPTS